MYDSEYATYVSVYATEKSVRGTEKIVYATHETIRGVFTEKHYSRILHYGIVKYV